jgi:hypothetical protein
VYFATYAPGGEEVEVGYFHNPNLSFNGYTLYVRHHGFWNQSKSEAARCGTTMSLQYLIGYDHNNGSVARVQVQSGHADGSSGASYNFLPKPGKATMVPIEMPWAGGPPHTSGKGAIAILSEAGWQNGCRQCDVGMLTAIAQNIPRGVPTNPLKDGAAFGPVSWKQIILDDHVDAVSWTSTVTASTTVWKPGITTAKMTGSPPTYTVKTVQVPCVASTTGADRWTC